MYFADKAESKRTKLFIFLAGFFITNALVAEFMGVKIFSLEDLLGIQTIVFSFLGETIHGISFTCGVLLWPFVFILTDIINEYYGRKGVRMLSYLTVILISYAFIMLNLAIETPPAVWWIAKSQYGENLNFDFAFHSVFGQGSNIIMGSLLAFLISQITDVYIFHIIKRRTGGNSIWLRATVSTLVSQLIDSFIVLFVAFYLTQIGKPSQWSFRLVCVVGIVNYIYKFVMALFLSPIIVLVHHRITRFLGKDLAHKMQAYAASEL